jgi:hypothetical protein
VGLPKYTSASGVLNDGESTRMQPRRRDSSTESVWRENRIACRLPDGVRLRPAARFGTDAENPVKFDINIHPAESQEPN